MQLQQAQLTQSKKNNANVEGQVTFDFFISFCLFQIENE